MRLIDWLKRLLKKRHEYIEGGEDYYCDLDPVECEEYYYWELLEEEEFEAMEDE
jgi:hypothetical protein